jgi:hypothetical protein
MGRSKGLASFSANFEAQMAAPIDARAVVETQADLITEATWQANDGSVYAYVGMVVSVTGDTDSSKNGLYSLTALPITSIENWTQLGTATAIDSLRLMATGDIILAVSSAGDDSDSNRPSVITSGDYSAYPFLTIQAAIEALPSFVRPYTATVNVGAGDFAGAYIFQRAGNYKIVGTLDLSALTTGSNAGTFSSGGARAATKTGETWTTNNLKGHFVKITAGRGVGQERVIVSNTEDTIVVAKKWTTSINSTSVFQILEPKSIITTAVVGPLGYTTVTIGLGGFEYSGRLTIENFAFALGTATASVAFIRGDFSTVKTVKTSQSYYPVIAQDMDEIIVTRVAVTNVIYYGSYFLRIAKSVGAAGEMFIDGSTDRTYFYSCRGIEFNGLYFSNITGSYGINFWDSTAIITDMVVADSSRGLFLAKSSLVIHGLELSNIANNAIELQDSASLKVKTSLTTSGLNYGIVLSNASMTSIFIKGMDATNILSIDTNTIDNVEYEEMLTDSGDCIYGTAGSQLMYSNT